MHSNAGKSCVAPFLRSLGIKLLSIMVSASLYFHMSVPEQRQTACFSRSDTYYLSLSLDLNLGTRLFYM